MRRPEQKSSSQGNLKTLLKGLKALEAVCQNKQGLRQSELAVLLDVDRSTALRILNTILDAGYLFRDGNNRYRPTMKIPQLSQGILEGIEIRTYARKQLEKITIETGLSSHLAIISRYQVVYVDGEEGRGMVKVNAGIGQTAPIHCSATGKALVSYLDENMLEKMLQSQTGGSSLEPYTDKTITEYSELLRECANIRKRGFAVDNEEYELGIRCIAAPVFDYSGLVVAAIGVSGTVSRIEEMGTDILAEKLLAEAGDISLSMGYEAKVYSKK